MAGYRPRRYVVWRRWWGGVTRTESQSRWSRLVSGADGAAAVTWAVGARPVVAAEGSPEATTVAVLA